MTRALRREAVVAVGVATTGINPDAELTSVDLARIGVRAAFVMIRGRGIPARLGVLTAIATVALAGCAG